MGKLDGRVALITGGARGQGRSHALAMAAEGAEIVVCDIAADVDVIGYPMATQDQLNETVKLIEGYDRRALGLRVDARDTAQVQAAGQIPDGPRLVIGGDQFLDVDYAKGGLLAIDRS